MLFTLIIVFRETLEAALIVAIVLAASKGISGRAGWVAGGVAAGLCGAAIVAFFASGSPISSTATEPRCSMRSCC